MSTPEQLKGDSFRRQVDKTDRYVKRHNLELVDNYDDIGVSAFRGLNVSQGELGRFLGAIQSGEVAVGSCLIVESLDRLTRNEAMEAIALMTLIMKAGVSIVALDTEIEFSSESLSLNPMQFYIAFAEMMRAHGESRRKSALLSDAWDEKRRKLHATRALLTSRVPAWLTVNDETGAIEPWKERAEIVREIFELAISGCGTYTIARMLDERGEPAWGAVKQTKARKKKRSGHTVPIWHQSYIKKILNNRAVLGEFQTRKITTVGDKRVRTPEGVILRDYYPQVVDLSTFTAANLAIERRRLGGKGRKGKTYSNLFTGILHCQRCGSGMRFLDKGAPPKGGKYLRCSRSITSNKCTARMYRYEIIEHLILSHLEALDMDRILGGKPQALHVEELRHDLAVLLLEQKSLQERIDITVDSLTRTKSANLASKLREIEDKHEEIAARIEIVEHEIDECLTIDPKRKQEVMDSLMRRIGNEVDDDERLKVRRALAAEIQRITEFMSIRADKRFAHEVMDADESWQTRYRVSSQTRLEKHLDDYGFEIHVRYRNGVDHSISGIDQKQFKLKWHPKFKTFRRLATHASD